MIESIPVPSEIKNRLDQLMQPGESYGDVINKLLSEAFDNDELNPEEEVMISGGFEAIKSNKTVPHDEVMKTLGVR